MTNERVQSNNGPQRRGATLIEFAFVAPVFFLLVLGLVEIGRACMVTELITEAARRACRQAIIEGTSTGQIQSAAANFLSSVGINGASANVYINDIPAGSTNVAAMPAYTEITVVVTVPVADVTWTPMRFLSGNLSGQYTMRRE
jgi:Flp pilus assembly protein TadG